MSDVLNGDLLNGIHLDFTFLHWVTATHGDLRMHPDAHAAGDMPATNTFLKTVREEHFADEIHSIFVTLPNSYTSLLLHGLQIVVLGNWSVPLRKGAQHN